MLSNCLRCRQESLRMLPPLADRGNAPSYSRSTYSPSNAIVSKKFRSGGTICAVRGFDTTKGTTEPEHGVGVWGRAMNERKPVGQQNQMETAATRNKKANLKPAKLGRDVQARLGQQLRAMYDDVVNQGVPDRFSELINRLNGDEKKDGR